MGFKKGSWIAQFERKVAYDRDTFMAICQRVLRGEAVSDICAKPPMPCAEVFLNWIQDNEEARKIWNCKCDFESDRKLAKELDVVINCFAVDWSNNVYDKLEKGYSLDSYMWQKYVMPDWKKLYPLLGDPPVWNTENLQDYEDLLKEITLLLKPRDFMECVHTKEMADAIWEDKREGREKNTVPELQYQARLSEAHALHVMAARQGNLPIPKAVEKPATAADHIRGFRAGFKTYQALDRSQERKKKRRDNAPRQIARWRKSFGGKSEVLPDRFVAELALAKRASEAVLPLARAQAATSDTEEVAQPTTSGDHTQEVPQPTTSVDQTQDVPQTKTSVALPDQAAEAVQTPVRTHEIAEAPVQIAPANNPSGAAPSLDAEEVPQATTSVDHTEKVAQATTSDALPDKAADAPPAPARMGETAQAAAQIAPGVDAEKTAPPSTAAGKGDMAGVTDDVDWEAWLTGTKRYPAGAIVAAARKKFDPVPSSQTTLVRKLVLECKVVPPDRLCSELAVCVLPIAQAAPTPHAAA
jgi:hypothetical protein